MQRRYFLSVITVWLLLDSCKLFAPEWGAEVTIEVDLAQLTDQTRSAQEAAVVQTVQVLRERTRQMGMPESEVTRQGPQLIRLRLPERERLEHTIFVLLRRALLEFRRVDDECSAALAAIELPEGTPIQRRTDGRDTYLESESRQALVAAVDGGAPPEREILVGPGYGKKGMLRTYVVHRQPVLTGEYLCDASVDSDDDIGIFFVSIEFDEKGGQIFERFTEAHKGERLAIILDNEVLSAPTIQEKISGGRARISLGSPATGKGGLRAARDLAQILRAGALPLNARLRQVRRLDGRGSRRLKETP